MSKEGKNGISSETTKNILFGAGTIHKNLKYADGAWNFAESLVGSTSGGSKVTIVPEITYLNLDGALVKTKGLSVKTGETATIEVNFAELSADTIKTATIGKASASEDSAFDAVEGKALVEEGDYWENIAFVGKTLEGKNVMFVMKNALCTSGLDVNAKAKEGLVNKMTFECHGDLNDDLDVLPWKFYYPKAST